MLYIAGFLAILIGCAHSFLGEKYILVRLFRNKNLPQLLGSDWFTKRTLRFAWHITTVAWWGFAAILFLFASAGQNSQQGVLLVVGAVFLISGMFSAGFSRGKHLSWVVFWAISAICFYAAIYS
ncbi:hypothetical protein SAMN06297229_1202 [Pseudidiomarina planktonica]|uniref:Uncharacterized protein n=1 Tax=Pseudidiomarina planktonica TaxID=1323738 RepID=A0A1Y6ESE8_9GAMM|nr:hypothetical protein [Pseudidiomarina planktonica]RUO65396.1 hypothetical protein CWI77_02750 [Pseudidiomarina planktonica]SMQ65179.1 hypothetical protein SAMN06297229_1202 [Pseudidiomarina planktonica]